MRGRDGRRRLIRRLVDAIRREVGRSSGWIDPEPDLPELTHQLSEETTHDHDRPHLTIVRDAT